MLDRLLSDDLPRSRVLARRCWSLIVLGLALAPFLFPGTKPLNVAAKICVFIVLVGELRPAARLHRHRLASRTRCSSASAPTASRIALLRGCGATLGRGRARRRRRAAARRAAVAA